MAHSQRTRLLDALVELVAEQGYSGVKVGEVARRAGVSLSTFYVQFNGKEQCFLAAYDSVVEALRAELLAALAGATTVADGAARAIEAFLGWFEVRPEAARTFLLEIRGAGPAALARRAEAIDAFAKGIGALIAQRNGAPPPSRALIVGAFAVVETLAGEQVLAGRTDELMAVAPDAIDGVTRLIAA